jgi:hypothetical protein
LAHLNLLIATIVKQSFSTPLEVALVCQSVRLGVLAGLAAATTFHVQVQALVWLAD